MSVEFDSIDDRIQCGVPSEGFIYTPSGGEAFTISAWVYVKGQPFNDTANTIIGRADDSFNEGMNWEIAYTSDTEVFQIFNLKGVFPLIVVSTGNYLLGNTWQHVLLTFDSSSIGIFANRIHMYVGGIEVDYLALEDGFTYFDNSANSVEIGNTPTIDQCFNGSITELAIWDVVLTAEEILALSKTFVKGTPLNIRPGNRVSYYPLDDRVDGSSGDGATFRDLGTNGSNGTGTDGANNTGLTCYAESFLSYFSDAILVESIDSILNLNLDLFDINADLKDITIQDLLAISGLNLNISLDINSSILSIIYNQDELNINAHDYGLTSSDILIKYLVNLLDIGVTLEDFDFNAPFNVPFRVINIKLRYDIISKIKIRYNITPNISL